MTIDIKLFSLHWMQKSSLHKTKHFFALVIKLFIVIGCGYFIYLKLTKNEQLTFSVFISKLTQNNLLTIKNGLILIGFTFFNWFFEIKKWHLLTNQIKQTSFSEATIQSLTSLTSSLITPNRIGEYGAKALCFEKPYRKQIVGLNLIGNLYQLSATVFFGLISIFYFATQQNIKIQYSELLFSLIFLTLITLLFYFAIKHSSFSKLQKVKKFISKIPFILNAQIGIISFLRFIIFSHQFYFLLILFNIDISYSNAITSISSMYLIASIIPMLSLFDVVLKSSVAIWIFSFYFIDETTIVTITMFMWILNFVLPSIVGSYFVLTFNTNKLIVPKG